MLLAFMAVALPFDLLALPGLRNVSSLIVSLFAALIFVVRGDLIVDALSMFLLDTFVEGWLGTLLIVRLAPNVVRGLIIGTGLVPTVRLAISTWRAILTISLGFVA